MADKEGRTETLQPILNRLNAGDERAADELLEHAMERLRRMARKRLQNYPSLKNLDLERTDDVLQGAAMRLYRALKAVKLPTVQDFLNLAATQIRRELIDLARHHHGPHADAAHRVAVPGKADSQGKVRPFVEAKSDSAPGPATEAQRKEMVEQEQARLDALIESLPDKERDVFQLIFYMGLSQEDVARQLGISVPTVKRRWRSARLILHKELKSDFPED